MPARNRGNLFYDLAKISAIRLAYAMSRELRDTNITALALTADPNVSEKAGTAVATWHLAKEYGFTDMDGRQPDWGTYYEDKVVPTLD